MRGEGNAPKGVIEKAKKIYRKTKRVDPLLAEFNEIFGMLEIGDDTINVVYPRWFYHHFKGVPSGRVLRVLERLAEGALRPGDRRGCGGRAARLGHPGRR